MQMLAKDTWISFMCFAIQDLCGCWLFQGLVRPALFVVAHGTEPLTAEESSTVGPSGNNDARLPVSLPFLLNHLEREEVKTRRP